MERRILRNEEATAALGAELAASAAVGTPYLLTGALGAGKTVFARGFLRALGWMGEVRSPTFTLLNPYPTDPPVLHADLYRVPSAEGVGLEDYESSHVLLIEWPDRLNGLVPEASAWQIEFRRTPRGREATIRPPFIQPPVG